MAHRRTHKPCHRCIELLLPSGQFCCGRERAVAGRVRNNDDWGSRSRRVGVSGGGTISSLYPQRMATRPAGGAICACGGNWCKLLGRDARAIADLCTRLGDWDACVLLAGATGASRQPLRVGECAPTDICGKFNRRISEYPQLNASVERLDTAGHLRGAAGCKLLDSASDERARVLKPSWRARQRQCVPTMPSCRWRRLNLSPNAARDNLLSPNGYTLTRRR
jgi:hypothetical protein